MAENEDSDLERLRAVASEADRGEGISLRGLTKDERRYVMRESVVRLLRIAEQADGHFGINISDLPPAERIRLARGDKGQGDG